ncbi:MAG: NAD(+)/NADH kinase [Elusimicrobiota bacterium]|jgi:NAD+ kinase
MSMPENKKDIVRSVVLFCNESKPKAGGMMRDIAALVRRHGAKVWSCRNGSSPRWDTTDLAVALGGDGTMLRAARVLAPQGVPLLGINYGHLGFLSGTDMPGFRKNIKRILRRRFPMEERWMVSVEVWRRGRRVFGPRLALNDCVIRSSEQARAVLLQARTGVRLVAEYFGDGLILATPTGSTAYALAASGPIVEPSLDVLLVAPICPHTLTQRPLVVSSDNVFSVRLAARHAGEVPHVRVSLDGQVGCGLRLGDEVRVARYGRPLRLVLDPQHSYFQVLREKLRWGEM